MHRLTRGARTSSATAAAVLLLGANLVLPAAAVAIEPPGVDPAALPPEATVVMTPAGVSLVIRAGLAYSVNHRLPSGPATRKLGFPPWGRGYCVTAPVAGSTRPMALAFVSATQ